MQIKVRSLQGDEYIVQVQEGDLVSSLKASISEKANGLPIERQKLVYKGRTMQDSMRLAEYNLEEDCKVHLILQKEPQQQTTNATTQQNTPSATIQNTASAQQPAGQSSGSPCPMDVTVSSSSSLSSGQSETGSARAEASGRDQYHQAASSTAAKSNHPGRPPHSRFEVILRDRLSHHFPANSVDKIMANLYQEIDADIHSSSLDDLERLAKQKLNITNE